MIRPKLGNPYVRFGTDIDPVGNNDAVDVALALVAIAATVILVARLCAPTGIPAPLALLAVGALASYVPVVPDVALQPDVVLYGLLPPLLYAAALNTSLVDIAANRGPILGLSVGLVLFTALAVAVVAAALLPISFALAFALGAIVAPPDAVAATAVARAIGLPRRVTTILEGESLLNDATALVALRTALAAAGLAAHGAHAPADAVTLSSVALDFGVAVLGGITVGWLVFLLVAAIRRLLDEPAMDTALSFVVPFLAYVPAEKVHASGVLAVVTVGLLLAHKAHHLQSASSRLSERINWASITFLLENAVFLLIGLQIAAIATGVDRSDLTLGQALVVALAVLLTVLLARPLWIFPFTWFADRISGQPWAARAPSVAVSSWAGMRGVVTLAAALTLPQETPLRPVLVLIALVVTVGTLLLQGATLPWLARAVDVRGPDPREDALVEATVLGNAVAAGLRTIEADPAADQETLALIRTQSTARVNRVWERLGTLGEGDSETPSEAYRRMRVQMISAERSELLRIRSGGRVDHEVLATVMAQLDAEEAALAWGAERHARVRESPLRAPEAVSGGCTHLMQNPGCVIPLTPNGCGSCLESGTAWVHLRMCTTCGTVGCCDSSEGAHASAHFHQTGHPVMRSIEAGEAWRWCYVDEVLG
jgi:Na+/H+ antiporter